MLSSETVRTHVKNILRKLDARSREEAVAIAQQMRGGAPNVTPPTPPGVRQGEEEAVADAAFAGAHTDDAAVALDDVAADRQAEPGAALAALAAAAAVGPEDPLALRGRDRRPVARDLETPLADAANRLDADVAAVARAVLEPVHEQVLEQRADQLVVGEHSRQRAELDVCAARDDLRREHGEQVADDVVELHRRAHERLAGRAGVVEQRLDQPAHARGAAPEGVEVAKRVGVLGPSSRLPISAA